MRRLRLLGLLSLLAVASSQGPEDGKCTQALASWCGAQQGDFPACSMCAGLHQSPLRLASCSHSDIASWCQIQVMDLLGFLCTCDGQHNNNGAGCTPMGLRNPGSVPAPRRDVVVQISADDAGVFDPMEPGRIDWNVTTTLVLEAFPGSPLWVWLFERPPPHNATALICKAHSNNVSVVLGGLLSPNLPWSANSTHPIPIELADQVAYTGGIWDVLFAYALDGASFDIPPTVSVAYKGAITNLM